MSLFGFGRKAADGKKVVAVVFVGMTTFVGIGSFYLPFYADRDKIRGLFEDENKTPEELYQKALLQEQKEASKEKSKQSIAPRAPGGMWGKLNGRIGRQSSSKDEK